MSTVIIEIRELLKKQVQDRAYQAGKMWEDSQEEINKAIDEAWEDYKKENKIEWIDLNPHNHEDTTGSR